MNHVRLEWFGTDIKKRVGSAEESAVRKTIDRAAAQARGNRRTKHRTGALDIQAFGAQRTADGATGTFGYTRLYGLFHEIGFRGRAGDHTLRRAGDREFTGLVDTLRADAGL